MRMFFVYLLPPLGTDGHITSLSRFQPPLYLRWCVHASSLRKKPRCCALVYGNGFLAVEMHRPLFFFSFGLDTTILRISGKSCLFEDNLLKLAAFGRPNGPALVVNKEQTATLNPLCYLCDALSLV